MTIFKYLKDRQVVRGLELVFLARGNKGNYEKIRGKTLVGQYKIKSLSSQNMPKQFVGG